MPEPTKPISTWDAEDLRALIADPPAEEHQRLDFKAECNILSPISEVRTKARIDLLKDIAAMANGDGGVLLIGVRQVQNAKEPPKAESIPGVPRAEAERIKKTMRELVDQHLDVRPAPIEIVDMPCDQDKVVLGVHVQANIRSLSKVKMDDLHQYWTRRGTDNRIMTTDEVEQKFRSFIRMHDDIRGAIDSIRDRLQDGIIDPRVWCAVIPIDRSPDHIPVKVDRIRTILEQGSYPKEVRGGGTVCTMAGFGESIVPTLHGLGLKRSMVDTRIIIEIHRTGTVIFACSVQRDGQIPLACIYEPILSTLYTFRDLQREYQMRGSAVAAAGLLECHVAPVTWGEGSWILRGREPPRIESRVVSLDPAWLEGEWSPRDVFRSWADVIGNAIGFESAPRVRPWIA